MLSPLHGVLLAELLLQPHVEYQQSVDLTVLLLQVLLLGHLSLLRLVRLLLLACLQQKLFVPSRQQYVHLQDQVSLVPLLLLVMLVQTLLIIQPLLLSQPVLLAAVGVPMRPSASLLLLPQPSRQPVLATAAASAG